jgi:hypothetical protein
MEHRASKNWRWVSCNPCVCFLLPFLTICLSPSSRAVIIPFRDILLTPYYATVARFDRLLQPSYRLITAYFHSFTDGTQERFMKMAWKSVINGEGIETGYKLVGKVREGWQKRWAEAERRLEAREKEKERLREEASRRGKDI